MPKTTSLFERAATSPTYARPSSGLPTIVRALSVLGLVGSSLWTFGFLALHYANLPALLSHNHLAMSLRRWLLLGMIGSGLLVALVALVFLLVRRSERAVVGIDRAALLACPLLLLWPLPVFLNPECFAGRELHFSLLALAFGLLLERLLRPSLRTARDLSEPRPPRPEGEASSRLPLALAVAAAVFFGCYFSWYSVLNHLRLQTSSWDLAIFDNMMWNLLRGEWFKASPDLGRTGSHIQYHATFAAYLIAPLYALRQQADTLLIIQGMLVGATCIPLYLLAQARTGSAWLAVLLAVSFGLHAPMHGPIFYDFHFLTLAPFFITWVLYFYETERRTWLIITWLAAMALREDQSATMAAAAFFFLLSNKRPRWALVGGLVSAAYFVSMKFGIMPLHRSGHDKETFSWMFKGLIPAGAHGFGGVIQTLISNPLFVLESLLDEEKLTYLLKTFGPVLFLPLRNARNWVLFVPATIFTLLSSGYKPLYQTYFQYTSNWTPYVFFATAVGLAALKAQPDGLVRVRSSGIALLVTALIFSTNQGAVLGRSNFRGGFRTITFERSEQDKTRYRDLMTLAALIPQGASVAATETEAPHVSNRADCFTMRFGYDDADYLLLSIAEAKSRPTREHLKEALQTGEYGFVKRAGDFVLWQKGRDQADNPAGLRAVGIRL